MNAPIEQGQQPATEPKFALDCFDVMDQSLSKARGIIFVMQQMRPPEVVAPELIEWALWAVNDFLFDAHKAMEEALELAQKGVAKP